VLQASGSGGGKGKVKGAGNQAADVLIRPEEAQDRSSVFEVNRRAFETELEARLVDAVRSLGEPLISRVAVIEDRVVGHILFSPVTVENNAVGALTMGLGPMAVEPALQRQGIGGRLVEAGLAGCRALGADAVFVLGHTDYYPRFGFQPALGAGCRYRDERFDPYFMVLELVPGSLASLSGRVEYADPFEAA
jgi:putative acetyltransferase